MRRVLLTLIALLSPAFALADVKIVGELKVGANRLVRLAADGDVKDAALIWDVEKEDLVDIEEVGGRLIFTGPPGVYKIKLRVIRSKDGKTAAETARACVTIGEPGPTPPGPGPPVPPVPPEDPLTRELRAALANDPGTPAEKSKWAQDLADLYRQAVGTANDPAVKTAGDLLAVLRKASTAILPPDALKGVRTRVMSELEKALPDDGAAELTPATRAAAAAAFQRISDSLVRIK